jgi:Scavenger receptor cysteine-rich domain
LGFAAALNSTEGSLYGKVAENVFSYDEVNCAGGETTLDDCKHQNTHDCKLNEGAGVICKV